MEGKASGPGLQIRWAGRMVQHTSSELANAVPIAPRESRTTQDTLPLESTKPLARTATKSTEKRESWSSSCFSF